jgi:hypothetical protein
VGVIPALAEVGVLESVLLAFRAASRSAMLIGVPAGLSVVDSGVDFTGVVVGTTDVGVVPVCTAKPAPGGDAVLCTLIGGGTGRAVGRGGGGGGVGGASG